MPWLGGTPRGRASNPHASEAYDRCLRKQALFQGLNSTPFGDGCRYRGQFEQLMGIKTPTTPIRDENGAVGFGEP